MPRLQPSGAKDGRWSGRRARLNGRTSSHHRGSDQQVVDTEVADLLHQAGRRAVDLLGEHRQTLDHLTELLLERETVDRADVDEILGSIPGRRQPVGVTGQAANSAGGQEPTSQASCRAWAKPSV